MGMGGLGGGGRGSSGARFVVNFSIEGHGEEDLKRITGLVENLQKPHSGAMEALGLAAAVEMGEKLSENIGEAGLKAMEVGTTILEVWGKAFETLLHQGSELEQMWLRIQATGKTGSQARDLMNQAVKFTQQLPITESESIRILTTLATAQIDALQPLGESYAELNKKGKTLKDLPDLLGVDRMNKEGPKAITLVGDMLAAMGHLGSGYQTQAIHELMEFVETGQARSPMTFGPLQTEFRNLAKHAHTAQDRVKGMMEILGKRGAIGLSQAAMSTFGGVMSNFKGLITNITNAVMEPGKPGGLMSNMDKAFLGLYQSIAMFFDEANPKGKAFLETLRQTVGVVAGILTTGMETLGKVIRGLFSFMADHPVFVKFVAVGSLVAATVALLAGGVLVLTGTVIGVTVAILGAAAALEALEIELLPILATVAATAAALGTLFIGALVLGAAAIFAFEHNLGGIKDMFEKVQLVIMAVSEAIQNWSGDATTISQETADKLEHAGVAGAFLKIVHWIEEAKVYWEGFSSVVEERWESIRVKFENAWTALSDGFHEIFQALFGGMDALNSKVENGAEEVSGMGADGQVMGQKFSDALDAIASGIETVAGWIQEASHLFAEFTDYIHPLEPLFRAIGTVLEVALIEPFKTFLDMLKGTEELMIRMGLISANVNLHHDKAEDQGPRLEDHTRQLGMLVGSRVPSDTVDVTSGGGTVFDSKTGNYVPGAPTQGKSQSHQYHFHPADVHLDGKKVGKIVFDNIREDLERSGFSPQGVPGPTQE